MNVYDIEKDGLPNMEELTGRVAFIFDGCIVSGWPLYKLNERCPGNNFPEYGVNDWEADGDVGKAGVFSGVEKYIIFDKSIWEL
jgi:hypothetical protein